MQNKVDGLLEAVIWNIKNQTVSDIESLCDMVLDEPVEDTAAIGMTLSEQLAAIEMHADDDCGYLDGVELSSIRSRIEMLTCLVIHNMAVSITTDILRVLEDIIEDNDLDFEAIDDENQLGWAVHECEREESESCRVYEYRGIDGQLNIDVWCVREQERDFYIPHQLHNDGKEGSIESQNKYTF